MINNFTHESHGILNVFLFSEYSLYCLKSYSVVLSCDSRIMFEFPLNGLLTKKLNSNYADQFGKQLCVSGSVVAGVEQN